MSLRKFALKFCLCCLLPIAVVATPGFAFAADYAVDNTTFISVSVNGGADTTNPGTSCVQIAAAVSNACTGGWVAIPNNNRQLVAAALSNKIAGSKILLYYSDSAGSFHCPSLAFTPCAAISIAAR